jgi:uncharacterized membrane protein YhaH (DUF805 family)
MNWYVKVLKNYADFGGRATRAEYWYFTLFNFLALCVLTFIDSMIGSFNADMGIGLLGGVYYPAVFTPTLAVSVRRLHDTDRSGWWQLIVLIPIIGPLVLLIFMVQDSQPVDNQYGPNPKPGNEGGSNVAVIAVAIIVFIIVTGILAAIAFPAYQTYVERAKQAQLNQGQSF